MGDGRLHARQEKIEVSAVKPEVFKGDRVYYFGNRSKLARTLTNL